MIAQQRIAHAKHSATVERQPKALRMVLAIGAVITLAALLPYFTQWVEFLTAL